MIRCIVSDLGRVLLGIDVERCQRKLCQSCDLSPQELWTRLTRVHDETGFQRGLAEPEAFYQAVSRQCGLALPFEEFCEVWSDIFWEETETIQLISDAPVERRAMLSNTNAIHWSWIVRQYPDLLRRFDRLIVSHEVGVEKPDPAIFQLVIDETGFRPEEHVFIDDLAANLVGAEAVGMDTILHTDAANLRQEFRRRGLA